MTTQNTWLHGRVAAGAAALLTGAALAGAAVPAVSAYAAEGEEGAGVASLDLDGGFDEGYLVGDEEASFDDQVAVSVIGTLNEARQTVGEDGQTAYNPLAVSDDLAQVAQKLLATVVDPYATDETRLEDAVKAAEDLAGEAREQDPDYVFPTPSFVLVAQYTPGEGVDPAAVVADDVAASLAGKLLASDGENPSKALGDGLVVGVACSTDENGVTSLVAVFTVEDDGDADDEDADDDGENGDNENDDNENDGAENGGAEDGEGETEGDGETGTDPEPDVYDTLWGSLNIADESDVKPGDVYTVSCGTMSGAQAPALFWASSNTDVATVAVADDGTVQVSVVGYGTASIGGYRDAGLSDAPVLSLPLSTVAAPQDEPADDASGPDEDLDPAFTVAVEDDAQGGDAGEGEGEGGPAAVDDVLTVDHFDAVTVSTETGTQPQMPATVTATWSDGTTSELAVVWGDGYETDPAAIAEADYRLIDPEITKRAGEYTIVGAVEVNGAYEAVTAALTVTEPAVVIESLVNPQVATIVGEAPQLPAAVSATWSDGTVADATVTWADVDASMYAQAGSFLVAGTVAADPSASVSATVTVGSPTSVQEPGDVSVAAGTAPALPATLVVTYSNGLTRSRTVNWEAVDASRYLDAGTFTVNGTVEGTDFTVQSTVTVSAATVTGIQNNLAVQTVAGTAPELPATASIRWSNGQTTNEPVTWNAVSASQYAQAGSFSVQGTAAGVTVSCTVTVTAPAAETPRTGDTTNVVPVVVAAVVGVAVVAAAVALIVKSRKRK
jgi:hypothetical protein